MYFTDLREVFDLFDFWDGRDGLIDAVKVGDLLRCCGLNPTQKVVLKHGGTKKEGTIYDFERFCKSEKCRIYVVVCDNLFSACTQS